MGKNTGHIDRILRTVLGIVAIVFAWVSWASLGTVLGSILAIVGIILVATAAMGFCPLYRIVGISTCKVK